MLDAPINHKLNAYHRCIKALVICSSWTLCIKLSTQFEIYSLAFLLFIIRYSEKQKMVPLKTNRCVLTWLCIYPAAEDTSKWSKLAHKVFTLSVLAYNVAAISISIRSFEVDDLEQLIFSVLHFAAELNSIYVFASTLILRHEITAMIDRLIEIYQKRKIWLFSSNFSLFLNVEFLNADIRGERINYLHL